MTDLQKKIHSLLFWKNEPMTASEVAKMLGVSKDDVNSEALSLQNALQDSGVVLMIETSEKDIEMRLATAKECSEMLDLFEKTERSKELSKAALETLSIILYKGPIRRSEIDYIRGVNSQFIVRHLEIRGLIEKEQSGSDARIFLYKPTLDLLAHLGVTDRKQLPEFESLV
ncbi:MAG TPA: SMC-Scp complex subunit ScpB, partial [Candidatus Paceibacterota bacterium]|nr:SMC-Scp complex subunit ScpB [Candidatus Paceibacterota bacterium]